MRDFSYHVQFCTPNDVWPNGGWSVYQINGDQIADRIVRERINPNGWYEGGVTHRHSWCGYLGMVETLECAMEMIKRNKLEQEARSK